jgi:hypothetical protein
VGILRAEVTGNKIVTSGRLEISRPWATTEHKIQPEEQEGTQEPIRDSIHERYVLTYRILTAYLI